MYGWKRAAAGVAIWRDPDDIHFYLRDLPDTYTDQARSLLQAIGAEPLPEYIIAIRGLPGPSQRDEVELLLKVPLQFEAFRPIVGLKGGRWKFPPWDMRDGRVVLLRTEEEAVWLADTLQVGDVWIKQAGWRLPMGGYEPLTNPKRKQKAPPKQRNIVTLEHIKAKRKAGPMEPVGRARRRADRRRGKKAVEELE